MREKLKHFSLFSGIESFKKALTNLGIENELVGYSEFDKYASVALSAIHGVSEDLNYGDITKIDETKVPDCDLITYGFPCQDISIAGLGKGIIEGETRSGLLYDALRIIKHKKPKYAIAENVKNLVGKKFKDDFNSLLEELDSYGYNNYWKVLNAKDYGIPQNRERVFVVSIRKDIDKGYEFPKPFDNGLRLKDLLEDEVEDKYYIDNDRTSILLNNLKEQDLLNRERFGADSTINDSRKRDISNCITARYDAGIVNQKQVGMVIAEPILIGGMQKNQSIKRDGMSTTLVSAMGTGGGYVPMIVASRGRNPEDPSDRTVGDPTEQRLEPNSQGIANTLTTVQKDNLVLEKVVCEQRTDEGLRFFKDEVCGTIRTIDSGGDKRVLEPRAVKLQNSNMKGRRIKDPGEPMFTVTAHDRNAVTLGEQTNNFRIRKLTPKECWRLMGFTDEDYFKARHALEDKFYNGGDRSNSQMYKMAGNSIVVDVLEGILGNLFKEVDQ